MKFSSLTQRVAGDSVDAWSVHYEGLARLEAGEDIIVLSVGQETEEFTAPEIVDAAVDSLRQGRHHYTNVNGNLDLREAVAARHREVSGQHVTANNVTIFAGTQNALFSVAQCLLETGDEVILFEPYYTTYPATFTASGATLVSVAARFDNGFQLDTAAIIDAITPRTRAIVINSPNNPVGVVYPSGQLEALARACVEKGIWLISDDVYQELLTPEEKATPASFPWAADVCVTVSSVSKSHRMTGWRLGWAIGPESLMEHLYNLSMCLSYGLPAFIQDAALAAIRSGTATAQDVREKLDRRRVLLLDRLAGIEGLELFAAAGGMFVVFDISRLPLSARDYAQGLLDRHDVAILPCDGFGASGSNLLRVSLCVDDARLGEACDRIALFTRAVRQGELTGAGN